MSFLHGQKSRLAANLSLRACDHLASLAPYDGAYPGRWDLSRRVVFV